MDAMVRDRLSVDQIRHSAAWVSLNHAMAGVDVDSRCLIVGSRNVVQITAFQNNWYQD